VEKVRSFDHHVPVTCDTTRFAGANLAEMASLGLPVPPGFTVRAEGCSLGGEIPKDMHDQVSRTRAEAGTRSYHAAQIRDSLAHIEGVMGLKFGAVSGTDTLLLSVRSGAAMSMPGMME
jgi:pyruvate, orthophosphate dikinase